MNLVNQLRLFSLILVAIIISSASLYYMSTVKVKSELHTYTRIGEVVQGIFELNLLTNEHIATRTKRSQIQWNNRHASLANLLLIIESHSDTSESDIINRTRLNLAKVRSLFLKIITIENLNAEHMPAPAKILINRINSQARLLSQQIVSDVNRIKDYSQTNLNNTENNLTFIIQSTLLLIAISFLLMTYWIRRSFLSPILKLNEHSSRLSQGDYHAKIDLQGSNEITDLSRSFNVMSKTIAEKIDSLIKNAETLEKSKQKLEQSILNTKPAELLYKEIFSSAADCLISINDTGIIQTINPAGEKIFGYREAELIGKNITIIMPSPYKEKHDSYLANYKKTGEATIIGRGRQVEGLRKDGTVMPIALAISEIHLEGAVYYSGVLRDITEELEAKESMLNVNQKLEATNKELEAYAYSISHDLRSPLRAIDGYSMILIEDFADKLDDEALLYLSRIRTGTGKMGELITDMLKMSRITQETLNIKHLNLAQLAEEEIVCQRAAHSDRDIEFSCENIVPAYGDEVLIRAVLENLLGNAVKYTAKQLTAKIEFSYTQAADGQAVFTIKDNGVGFNMDYKDKLFKAFQRLHKNNEFEGSGIGLATVQRIIERHNGKIWAESEPNKGAIFYFTLNPDAGNNG